jgi:hypothetical protein
MAVAATATFSEFLREPKRVIRQLDKAGRVVIERRDADNLVLMNAARAEENSEGIEIVAHVLAKALAKIPSEVFAHALEERLPWVRFLPPAERDRFTREFLTTAEASGAAGSTAALAQLIHEWKATAEVWSDPKLAAELRRPLPTPKGGPVLRPRQRRASRKPGRR